MPAAPAAPSGRQDWMFEFAPPAYQIRSAEKDHYYKGDITEQLTDAVTRIVGTRVANRFEQELRLVAAGLYFGLTMGTSRQTLGEEYCDVIQVHETQLRPLRTASRLLQASLHILAPYLIDRWLPPLLLQLRNHADRLPESLRGPAQRAHRHQLTIKQAVHQALRLHLAVFYIFGRFYHISQRATRGRLLLMNKPRRSMEYGWMGWLIIIQMSVELIQWLRAGAKPQDDADPGESDEEDERVAAEVGKCTLCLGPRDGRRGPTTATVCGHLYCWDCITDLCRSSSAPQCPLCRERISLQTLAPIYRYKPS